jgi:hypothetical protein
VRKDKFLSAILAFGNFLIIKKRFSLLKEAFLAQKGVQIT